MVQVRTGTLRGMRQDGIRVFKGIPYAAPPVGELRFAAPRPATPWSGIRDATRFAEPAPQIDIMTGKLAGDEDCLYLNVYAPAEPGPHPVFVWIHGGSGLIGTPNDYDGTLFAQHGVVVVTVAYRLGVLGLLHLPGIGSNFALQDQVAALAWVRDNITAFGGDPARVTAAGESNGGRSVATLLATPSARGLFGQAIVQSGTGAGYAVMDPEQATNVTEAVLAELGLDLTTAARLRDAPVPKIVEAQSAIAAASSIRVPFQLVVDGTTLPNRPIDAITGEVSLLVGTNHDEQDLFWKLPGASGSAGTESMVVAADRLATATAAYRELLPADWSDDEVRRHAMTSSEWWIPAIRLAQAQHRAGGRVWMYRLDWRLAPRGTGMGAPHALDLPLVFGRNDSPWMRFLFRAADPDRFAAITTAMHSAWVRFVSTGDPGWPGYDSGRTTYLFDDSCRPAEDPDRELRLVWRDLL